MSGATTRHCCPGSLRCKPLCGQLSEVRHGNPWSRLPTATYRGGARNPDNLRSGVSRAHRYEPDLNPTYHDLADHYGVAVLPTRVRRPRDKAKAEVAVQVVERWILAALRNRTFFSLDELNAAIAKLLERLNTRPFRKLPGSRRTQFELLDQPALRPLPSSPYVFAEWKSARVHIDYHVEVDGHYYSVPHALVRRQLDVRLTAHTVECFHRGQRVASHVRSSRKARHTTAPEHMRRVDDWRGGGRRWG